MHVYLVRHGVAFEHGDPAYPNDDDRPLTPDGRKRFRRAAAGLLELIDPPAAILTSPLPRALQTAEILQQACGGATSVVHSDGLRPGGSFDHVLSEIMKLLDEGGESENANPVSKRGLALVGHEPSLGLLGAWLLSGDHAGFALPLRKGGSACFSFDGAPAAGAGQLEWLMTPKIMRSLGG